MATYDEVLAHLDALQMHKIKLGLDAMESFLAKVGRPEKHLRFVHVAGTNGKGSVCATVSAILERAGYRVGVYTSPHLSSVRERFRINDEYISREKFAAIGTRIIEVLGDEQITYFEFTTALGLLWFVESNVDIVMLETGLGGRLDATNVVTPLVSVITSISMDHEIWLGNSLREIAGEKAGIIKNDVPVVSGARLPEAAEVIARVSVERDSPLYVLGQDFDYERREGGYWNWISGKRLESVRFDGLHCGSNNLVQQENDSLSLATIQLLRSKGYKVSDEAVRAGVLEVRWAGRMEYFENEVRLNGASIGQGRLRYLLVGAHNPDGVENLANTVKAEFKYRKLIAVWGAMADKDLTKTIQIIGPVVDELILTRPVGERSANPEQMLACLAPELQTKARCEADVAAAVSLAQQDASDEDLIVVGGSLYLVGAVRRLLLGELAG